MANYLSYDYLEKKIRQIKDDVENLCQVVDKLSDVENIKADDYSVNSTTSYHTAICGCESSLESFLTALESFGNKHSADQLTNTKNVEFNDYDNLSMYSEFSYHTALGCSHLSLDSFMTAMENFEEDSFNISDQHRSKSFSHSFKKTVSFSTEITVLDMTHKRSRANKTRTKINHIKNKFIDYLYREKFYLKYKWRKLKNNFKHSNKSINTFTDGTEEANESTKSVDKTNDNETLINLNIFFNQCVVNFVLETDIDHNSISFVYRDFSFQQTDFSSPKIPIKNIAKTEMEKNNGERKIHKASMIEPKLTWITDGDRNRTDSINCDILFKYLVSKAQYPIQLKIANSIVKLNLPVWFQNSLIV